MVHSSKKRIKKIDPKSLQKMLHRADSLFKNYWWADIFSTWLSWEDHRLAHISSRTKCCFPCCEITLGTNACTNTWRHNFTEQCSSSWGQKNMDMMCWEHSSFWCGLKQKKNYHFIKKNRSTYTWYTYTYVHIHTRHHHPNKDTSSVANKDWAKNVWGALDISFLLL